MNQMMSWEYDPDSNHLFYIENEHKYRVKAIGIYANGIKDSCISVGSNGEPTITKIDKTPKEKILAIPDDDIVICELDREKDRFLIFDSNPSTKTMLSFIAKTHPNKFTGKKFAMYGGNNYDE